MKPEEKYGPISELPAAAKKQVAEAGQKLVANGVTHDTGAAQTPAAKYGAPDNNNHAKALSRERSR